MQLVATAIKFKSSRTSKRLRFTLPCLVCHSADIHVVPIYTGSRVPRGGQDSANAVSSEPLCGATSRFTTRGPRQVGFEPCISGQSAAFALKKDNLCCKSVWIIYWPSGFVLHISKRRRVFYLENILIIRIWHKLYRRSQAMKWWSIGFRKPRTNFTIQSWTSDIQ